MTFKLVSCKQIFNYLQHVGLGVVWRMKLKAMHVKSQEERGVKLTSTEETNIFNRQNTFLHGSFEDFLSSFYAKNSREEIFCNWHSKNLGGTANLTVVSYS